METEDDPCFCVDKSYNANRGPTDKQSDESPFETKLRTQIEARVGKATSPQHSMADEMSDSPSVLSKTKK